MGTFFHPITIIGPTGIRDTLDAMVDTGAMFTTVPTPVLERLGVRPFRTMRVRFVNGETQEWPMGHVEAELDGQRSPILCLFGSPDAPPLLGAHALEAFLLTVDPVEEKLVTKEAGKYPMSVEITDILYLRLETIFRQWDDCQEEGQVDMKCPTCAQNTPDNWQPLSMVTNAKGAELSEPAEEIISMRDRPRDIRYSVSWMVCANDDCQETVIQIQRTGIIWSQGRGMGVGRSEQWLAVPRYANARPIDPVVPEDMRRDYNEASQILDLSPRMSAVLSRRILADLLDTYAQLTDYRLSARIDNFIQDTSHPSRIRENLHVLRSMADFSAHTKRDESDQSIVIDVSREEAKWTLDVVERLFDYFIVTPAQDAARRAEMNEKRKAAGQDPIPDLPDSQQGVP